MLAGFASCVLAAPVVGQALESDSRFIVELEGGPAWQAKNDVQVPNDASGTRFALDDLTGSGPFPAFRLYAEYRRAGGTDCACSPRPCRSRALGCFPSRRTSTGSPSRQGPRLTATVPVRLLPSDLPVPPRLERQLAGRYRPDGEDTSGRDLARTGRRLVVRLEHRVRTAAQCRRAAWQPAPGWSLALDADGAAASQGRAFDVSLKLYRDLSDRWSLSAGYRTLEGGADTDDVYTFAWFNYFTVSAVYRF